MSAYRTASGSSEPRSLPILWRPWMGRLAIVGAVAGAPVLNAWSLHWIVVTHDPNPPWWALLTGIALFVNMVWTTLGVSFGILIPPRPKALVAVRMAWAVVYYPVVFAYRLGRWVVLGSDVQEE